MFERGFFVKIPVFTDKCVEEREIIFVFNVTSAFFIQLSLFFFLERGIFFSDTAVLDVIFPCGGCDFWGGYTVI